MFKLRNEAEIAKYRMSENEGFAEIALKALGADPHFYGFLINGNPCKVITSNLFGAIQITAGIHLGEDIARLPTYDELLVVKETFFKEYETVIFGITKNPTINYVVANQAAIHMYEYHDKLPPIQKVMAIEEYKVDGKYHVAKGRYGGWHYVRITGRIPQFLFEIEALKQKYMPNREVAILLIKEALIMWSNPKAGIRYYHQVIH